MQKSVHYRKSELQIYVYAPNKYAGNDVAVNHFIALECGEIVSDRPIHFLIQYDDFPYPHIRLFGNARRIGPKTEAKLVAAVQRALGAALSSELY